MLNLILSRVNPDCNKFLAGNNTVIHIKGQIKIISNNNEHRIN